MVEYVHYGSSSFDESQFSPVRNEMFTKPSGGFWASSGNAQMGWVQFVLRARLQRDLTISFSFRLSPETKVLHLRKYEDLEFLPKIDFGLPVDFSFISFS